MLLTLVFVKPFEMIISLKVRKYQNEVQNTAVYLRNRNPFKSYTAELKQLENWLGELL